MILLRELHIPGFLALDRHVESDLVAAWAHLLEMGIVVERTSAKDIAPSASTDARDESDETPDSYMNVASLMDWAAVVQPR